MLTEGEAIALFRYQLSVLRSADQAQKHQKLDLRALESGDWVEEWLVQDLWPDGRQLHIHAQHKSGKSLFALFVACCLATGRDPITGNARPAINVAYVDAEMTMHDVRERLADMEFRADDLDHLQYFLSPSLPPMDTAEGGTELLEMLQAYESHAVIIDTLSRVVDGDENSNDTYIRFYRHTGMQLKRAGISMMRLDHQGHESHRSRGASAKADDVDVVWGLTAVEGGIRLDRTHSRIAWVPERIDLLQSDEPLRYGRALQTWSVGTFALAQRLTDAGIPVETPFRKTKEMLRAATPDAEWEGVSNARLSEAIRYRKNVRERCLPPIDGNAHAEQ